MSKPPAAFLSYVRFDDQHEEGRITQLCQRLEGEVRMQTGEKGFTIFQDRRDIGWGQAWQERIDGALDTSTFFIPILTPLFFESEACRDELQKFLRREEELHRSDLVLPLYYVDSPRLNDPAERTADPLAQLLAQRQRIDWRDLRFEPQTDPRVGKLLAEMALQIRAALARSRSGAPTASTPAAAGAAVNLATEAPVTVEVPQAKAERPTHVVDPDDGPFTSIAAAVEAASPGDRILIRPGRYAESVGVDKPIEILGDGPLDEIVVAAFVWRAAEGRLANLTLRQRTKKLCGVSVEKGRLELEGCDITSSDGPCVAIQKGAYARLSRNRIHDGGSQGVVILGDAGALIEDNDIFAQGAAGIRTEGPCRPIIQRNRVHSGTTTGIEVVDGGRCTIENNEIYANAGFGIDISRARPVCRRNRIHHGRAGGIRSGNDSTGVLEGNEILFNVGKGVEIFNGSTPTVVSNQISGNVAEGIHVHSHASPMIRGNSIRSCQTGIVVSDEGQANLEENEITLCHTGLEITRTSSSTARRNRISENLGDGVYIDAGSRANLEGNKIVNNASHGLFLNGGSQAIARGNEIAGHGATAITIYDGGGTFQENDLRNNPQGVWRIFSTSEPRVIRIDNLEP